jgi:hypothetical protein
MDRAYNYSAFSWKIGSPYRMCTKVDFLRHLWMSENSWLVLTTFIVKLTSYDIQECLRTLTSSYRICSITNIKSFIWRNSIRDDQRWRVDGRSTISIAVWTNVDISAHTIDYLFPVDGCVNWVGRNCTL